MYKIDFNKPCRIHFIGIGGISMSGFAEYLHNKGFTVSGSDSQKSKITEHLVDLGIDVHYGQRKANITSDIELVVYTAAISKDNEEYLEVLDRNIPILNRSELIGQLMINFDNSIAVAGTHGKTTTTSMLSQLFINADLDPTISVGGILEAIGGNIRVGNSQHFIVEACEYTNSYLDFKPKISVILNIDADHLDFFKDIDDIRNSFHSFAKLLSEDGQLFINGEIDNYEEITNDLDCQVITYGISDSKYRKTDKLYDYSANNIDFDNMRDGSFDLYAKDKLLGRIKLDILGLHNISNSLPAIAIALEAGIPIDIISDSLSTFKNSKRRFEYKGTIGGVSVVDDYAHHPTAISATLSAARAYPHNTLWCVFQPHTYSRTKQHLNEFAEALALADKVVLSEIYAAREKNPGDISSMDLAREIELLGKEVYYFPGFDEIENFLLLNCINGDLLITMGAGDIVCVGESLLGQ
ncbi:MAG TPA: UDP-N-acetylmuramate--L-alanine ligase [Epulopiscium sp.]|jgi:UDP-N-acetylmuramate--alanine ligase|nr:UDP-N-acetylmuramate--L-alanine ligase [Candidatus Epulonipiscium sp.]